MSSKSWDDIDIGGLSMDSGEDSPQGSYLQRHERISSQDLANIVMDQGSAIEVRIENMTGRKEFTGIVKDVSAGGAKIIAAGTCSSADIMRISFKLGKRQILCRAKVAWAKKEGEKYIIGVQFIKPSAADVDFIMSVISAKHLK